MLSLYKKQIKSRLQDGFSALELLIVLAAIAAVATMSIGFGNSIIGQEPGENVANQAYNYSQAVIRYITTHQNLLRQLLSEQDASNRKIATVSTDILIKEGFIKNSQYYKNKLNQSPCTVIWYDNHQLQSFIYYRDNNDSKQLDNRQWAYGLNHMGSMLGLYAAESVVGAAKDWGMDAAFVNQYFITQGIVDISRGQESAADYYCIGSKIAKPSYVVNVTSMLTLNNTLPKDDTIHQYPDALHDTNDELSNNQMNTDLNMDHTKPGAINKEQSNVIFQMNSDCQIDPNDAPTMEDYSLINPRGCKNKQLAIQAMNDPVDSTSTQKIMMVTGFQQGGDQDVWTQQGRIPDTRPFVGELSAASFQPTTQLAVGTACSEKEIGTMSRQQRSADPNDVNNIYVSQLICMKSPLCEASTGGFCYMPVQNVTLQIKPGTLSYTCPVGTFIDTSNLSINHIDITGQGTCHAHDCAYQPYDCKAYNPRRGDIQYSDMLNTAFQTQAPLYRSLTIPSTSWEQWCGGACHFGCGEGPGQIADTQDTISSIQCTNDPNKASLIIQVN